MSKRNKVALAVDNQLPVQMSRSLAVADNKIAVHLVGKNGLLKEGIKSMLAKTEFRMTGDYENARELPGEDTKAIPAQVVIAIEEEGNRDTLNVIRALKNHYSRSHVIIISDDADMPKVSTAFSAGIDGYLLRNISCEGLVGSLKLVMSGEKVYPAAMLSMPSPSAVSPDSKRATVSGQHPLSGRELEVIRHLANGAPNKTIADRLNLAEGTVKVHIKTILRKLGAANRTQAAIMAVSQGLVPLPE
jgi:two-component system, NarL family, nitrate/nitrite response regulator NarL